ncbi:MAG: site-2 protease family protein [Candidatus Staskawiczbacteria bacterium]|nr:site-2 protease family protein [Candidatus Staskawiczbacteria bacterium]
MEIVTIITFIFVLVVLLFSVVIHELAHGSVAFALGDPTAKQAGRLTLNPLKHLDPVGSIILPILLVLLRSGVILGWAKPVPINPYNFRDKKWGSLKVSIAGPASNIALALFFGLLIRFLPQSLFAAVPGLVIIFQAIVVMNLVLAFFNLLPIPPLDGHWILFHFLPIGLDHVKYFLQQYGIFILFLLLFFGALQWLFGLVIVAYIFITGGLPIEFLQFLSSLN